MEEFGGQRKDSVGLSGEMLTTRKSGLDAEVVQDSVLFAGGP